MIWTGQNEQNQNPIGEINSIQSKHHMNNMKKMKEHKKKKLLNSWTKALYQMIREPSSSTCWVFSLDEDGRGLRNNGGGDCIVWLLEVEYRRFNERLDQLD